MCWDSFSSAIALLEGFEVRECISYIEEHINRQVSHLTCLLPFTL